MEIKDIITLIHEVSESKLTSFTYEQDGVKLSFEAKRMPKPPKFDGHFPMPVHREFAPVSDMMQPQMVQSMPVMAQSVTAESSVADNVQSKENTVAEGKMITSPMVGTFYCAGKEGDEPFVTVGDYVKKGQVVGIVEAMKLMNEIESPYEGVVAEILVNNKDMVGFGQEIIRLK